jgi:hypothetical protein
LHKKYSRCFPGLGNGADLPGGPGIYSSIETKAVSCFQSLNNLKQTGSVGPKTLAKINSMICGTTNQVDLIKKLYPSDQSGFGY